MDRNIQIEPLLQELDQQKALFDRFCLTEMKRLQALSANCENMTEETKRQLEQLKQEKAELETRLDETKKHQGSKKSEVDAVLADVANLKLTLTTELPLKLAEQNKKLEQEQIALQACRKDIQAKMEGRQLRKNELSMGVTFYKERLGLAFERMPDNSISLRMTLIDPENPARPFSFAVLVNSKNKYEVLRCEPKVDYDQLLANLNQDNNFSVFVQSMRRLFKKLV